MKETVLLFDLDGTLTDSREGIVKCLQVALSAFGIVAEDKDLGGFIGPPLTYSFPHFYGFGEEDTQRAIGLFRARYSTLGKFENRVYDGIPEALGALKAAGYRLGVATSKPQIFADQIVRHFGLDTFFECVSGTSVDETGNKEDAIRGALTAMRVQPENTLMIGDRLHDIEGGHNMGLRAVGALWGYGGREELTRHGADLLCESPGELVTLLGQAGRE